MILEYDDFDDSLIEFYCFKLHRTTIENELDIPSSIKERQSIYELMNQNNIDEIVKNYFYNSDSKFSDELETYFFKRYPYLKGKKINVLPFSLNIFGAYFNRSYVFKLLMNCKNGINDKRLILEGKEINSFSELAPYLIEYSKGFNYGYENFIADYVCQNLLIDDKNERTEKVFDFVTNENILKEITGYNNNKTFNKGIIYLNDAYNEGKFFGFVYKAWSLIFANYKQYRILFNDLLLPKLSTNIKAPQRMDIVSTLALQLQKLIFIINNDKGCYVYQYFIKEIDNTFLDLDKLQQYLSTTKVENTAFLKDLIFKADEIINYWNITTKSLPQSKPSLHLSYVIKIKDDYVTFTTFFDFHALSVYSHKLDYAKNDNDKTNYLKEYNYQLINIHTIAERCNLIINYITSAYPDIDYALKPELPNNNNEIEQDTVNLDFDSNESIHPKFYPNYWNKECFELFKYLYDNYYDNKTKRNLTNIWFFLKELQSSKYLFDITKEQYIDFIKTNYKVQLTNFNKAEFKYDNEVIKFRNHRLNFENYYK